MKPRMSYIFLVKMYDKVTLKHISCYAGFPMILSSSTVNEAVLNTWVCIVCMCISHLLYHMYTFCNWAYAISSVRPRGYWLMRVYPWVWVCVLCIVCVSVCVCISVVCVYELCVLVCVWLCMYVYIMYVCVHACIYLYVCMYECVCVCVYVYVCKYKVYIVYVSMLYVNFMTTVCMSKFRKSVYAGV